MLKAPPGGSKAQQRQLGVSLLASSFLLRFCLTRLWFVSSSGVGRFSAVSIFANCLTFQLSRIRLVVAGLSVPHRNGFSEFAGLQVGVEPANAPGVDEVADGELRR